MRIYCASLIHETNRFSPIPTDLDSFREVFLYLPSTGEGRALLDAPFEGVSIGPLARARGHEVIDGPMASAEPSAPLRRDDYLRLREEITAPLRATTVDAVMLFLHGAQVAEGCDDCEADICAVIRALVGPDVPIGVEIDPHANISPRLIDSASIVVSAQEYPHVDFESRAHHLLDLVEAAAAGTIRPAMAYARVPMFGSFYTTRQPMRDFVDATLAHQGQAGVLSVSLIHGFPWADVAGAGAGVIVVADQDAGRATDVADEIARQFFALRDRIVVAPVPVDQALAEALASDGGPVVIGDTTDNPGGGAPGDSTFLLRALLDHGVTDAALGMIWDPVAVDLAAKAGEGARIPLRLGGKCGPLSGLPLDVTAQVLRVRHDACQDAQGRPAPLGLSVALRVAGVDVIANTVRQQVFDPACFTEHGVDPRAKRIVVVKSHQHFVQTFGPFAARIIYASPSGVVARDFTALAFRNITRPVWPIDDPPFAVDGRTWS